MYHWPFIINLEAKKAGIIFASLPTSKLDSLSAYYRQRTKVLMNKMHQPFRLIFSRIHCSWSNGKKMESRLEPNISQMVTHQPFLSKGNYSYQLLQFKQNNYILGTHGINILQSIWKNLLIMLFKSFVFVLLLCPWTTQVEH